MTTLRSATRSDSGAPDTGHPPVPAARRAEAPGWRDPRLVLGIALVAVSVLVGARLVGGADDTVTVWRADHHLAQGAVLGADDLAPERVRLTGEVAERYLGTDSRPAAGSTLARDVAAGELLPRSALSVDDGPALVEVPLSVAPDDVPRSVDRGAVVDVWVTPAVPATGDARSRARLALDDVVVVAVPPTGDGLAPSTTRQVIVGVEAALADDLGEALGLVADGRVVLTRQAGS